jgi:hypothetical protein
MPRLYFILRFEADDETRSSCRTKDITMTGLPMALEADTVRTVKTYTAIDDDTTGTPWAYLVAFEIIKIEGKGIHVSYDTASRDDALQRFKKTPEYVIEGDKERPKNDKLLNADLGDEHEDEGYEHETDYKAEFHSKEKLMSRSNCGTTASSGIS